jgi:oligoendopeptidase F
MNYKEDAIRDVFTLAHEGGHSMHSWYSARSNPFMQYNYTIFEAEVASTFNEELLFRHLEKNSAEGDLKLYLINKRADDLLATLYRQTMFAEFEKITHSLEEGGTPLTVEVLRAEYRKLLEKYFGPAMTLEPESDLEGLRIPHFYRAFYVYKYATGVSAALALAEQVLAAGWVRFERLKTVHRPLSGQTAKPLGSSGSMDSSNIPLPQVMVRMKSVPEYVSPAKAIPPYRRRE